MPVVGNRYYNNPQIGQAFANLAQMFAPPSAQDTLAYAKAAEARQNAERLASLYRYSQQGPDVFNQTAFDRMGQAAGVWTPNQGYYALDQGDATARRGQDLVFQASTQNNAADNQRALQTNALDNQRALLGSLFGPLNQGQVRPAVSSDISSLYGLPAIPEAAGAPKPLSETEAIGSIISGMSPEVQQALALGDKALKLGQGETAFLADGQTVQGAPKPLTEPELTAQIIAGLSPEQQQSYALSSAPVETIVGPDGAPTFANRADAVGQQAYVNKGAEAKPQTANYRTPDGRTGTAVLTPNGWWADSQTGEKLPAGISTYGAQLQGSASDTGLGPTTANRTSGVNQAAELDYAARRVGDFQALLQQNPGIVGLPGQIRGFAQDIRNGLDELVAAYGLGANSIVSPDQIREVTTKLAGAPGYDPNIRKAQAMAIEMAFVAAKLNDPQGEVALKEMMTYLDKFNGGIAGNDGVLAALSALSDQIQARRSIVVPGLLDPPAAEAGGSAAPPPMAAPAAAPTVERWMRGPDGQLMRAQ